MNTNFYQNQYKHRYLVPRKQPFNRYNSLNDKKDYTIQLRRVHSVFSFYDNNIEDENKSIVSKWTIVRQRLPDILALSETYKPTSIRAQLALLVALMNRQTNPLHKSSNSDFDFNLLHIPTNVFITIGKRNRLIDLKRIAPEQMIYVDLDDFSFSIPTRQFIIAISRGDAHETAMKYCPAAMSDMLIEISKRKVANEGKQYRRALIKRRIGQMLFFISFIFIIGMILLLIVSLGRTVFKLNSFNHTNSNISITSLSSNVQIEEYFEWK